MQRRRGVLGKRLPGDSGAAGQSPKRNRTDQEVPAMNEDSSGAGSSSARPAGSAGESSSSRHRNKMRELLSNVPRAGTIIDRTRVRTAGPYVIGHELGTSPGVPQTQFLARKDGTSEFYLLKILSFDVDSEHTSKETQQGKTLLHTEYSLLSLLGDLDGVIHHHGLFCDYALEEKQIINPDHTVQWVYTGKVKRRLILVLDCVHAHEFCDRSAAYVNLQKYVQSHRFSELEALTVFYEIVKVVEQLHQRNVIHRDLKLNNIVLNRRTNKVVLTNFFLAKHLNSEDDNLYDQRGSPAYISPDVLGGKPYKGKPSDVWALGVILFTIVYGKFPFLDTTPAALFKKIRQADYTIPIETKTSPLTIKLIKAMLTLNPTERYTATDVRSELRRTIATLRGPQIEIDQIVPEVEEFDVPQQERTKTVTTQTSTESGTPSYPSHQLSREAFSRLLESGIHRREQESFLRPRSLVNRVANNSRSTVPLLRNLVMPPNRMPPSNGGRNPVASIVVNRPTVGGAPILIRSPNRPDVLNYRVAPMQNAAGEAIPVAAPQQIPVPPLQQPQAQQPVQNAAPRPPQPGQPQVFVQADGNLARIITTPAPTGFPAVAVATGNPNNFPIRSFTNPDVQCLFAAMNDMFVRGRMPVPTSEDLPDFHGYVTLDMANKCVAWLQTNFRGASLVREIFGSTDGNKVNNLLELMRRFGVAMDSIGGNAIIRVQQNIDVLMFMTYLLQVAGMNNGYFLNS